MKNENDFNEKLKNAVTDVNAGIDNLKIITGTIQEANPILFSEKCEELLKTIHPDNIVNYSITAVPMPTGRGLALMMVAIIQYWATPEEVKAYQDEIKRQNLLIKP